MPQPQVDVCCAMLGCLAVSACDPVLLEGSKQAHGASSMQSVIDAGPSADTPDLRELDAGQNAVNAAAGPTPIADLPDVVLSLTASDCGSCFDVSASARGGLPPYRYEWEDGSNTESRHVCVGSNAVAVAIVAEDSKRTIAVDVTAAEYHLVHVLRDTHAERAYGSNHVPGRNAYIAVAPHELRRDRSPRPCERMPVRSATAY
jgi:hypothetical protein